MPGWESKLLEKFRFIWYENESKEQDIIQVERIYEQYTKAEVAGITDKGNIFKDTIWLDIPGVREDDYVAYYYDKEQPTQISFEYYSKTLLLPVIFGIIFLIFFIVFLMEWKNTKSVTWKWRTRNGKEE